MPDNLERGIFPNVPQRTTRRRKEFAPWHKPRKQYVRRSQLLGSARDVWESKPEHDRETFSYLGLPGADFLDLRVLLHDANWWSGDRVEVAHGEASDAHMDGLPRVGPNLRVVSLDDSSGAPGRPIEKDDANVSQAQFKRHERIRDESEFLRDNFRDLGRLNSMAYKKVQELGPFDLVNLDLCESLLSDSPQHKYPNYYGALSNLFSLQTRVNSSWRLLITTRVDKDAVDPDILNDMVRVLDDNRASVENFELEFKNGVGVPIERWANSADLPFQDGLCVALLKWIVMTGNSAGFKVKVTGALSYSVRDSEGDIVEEPRYDLVSFSISFIRRNDPVDMNISSAGLPGGPDRQPGSEVHQAIPIVKRIARMSNVDTILREDEEMRNVCIRESAELLSQCGYSEGKYLEWVRNSS